MGRGDAQGSVRSRPPAPCLVLDPPDKGQSPRHRVRGQPAPPCSRAGPVHRGLGRCPPKTKALALKAAIKSTEDKRRIMQSPNRSSSTHTAFQVRFSFLIEELL